MTRTRKALIAIAPFAVGALFSLLAFTRALDGLGGVSEGLAARLRPRVEAAREILIVELPDPALREPARTGDAALADLLVAMIEFGARAAAFDLGPDRSSDAAAPAVSRESLELAFDREFGKIEGNIRSLFDAIRYGSLRPSEAPGYVTRLLSLTEDGKARLLAAALGRDAAIRDRERLERAAALFGGVYQSLEFRQAPPEDGSVERYALPGLVIALKKGSPDPSRKTGALRVAPRPRLEAARGAGFSSPAVADAAGGVSEAADEAPKAAPGLRGARRVRLIAEFEGRHYGQLAFVALRDRLGRPGIEIGPREIALRGARRPGGPERDIAIPLARDGRFLVEEPAAAGRGGLRRVELADFERLAWLEGKLVAALKSMEGAGHLEGRGEESSALVLHGFAADLLAEILATGDAARIPDWRASRARFFALASSFLGGTAEERILEPYERALSGGPLGIEAARGLGDYARAIREAFADARSAAGELARIRSALADELPESLCFVAGREEARVSAALADAILSERFPREVPDRVVAGAGAALALAAALVSVRRRPAFLVVAGASSAVLAVAACAAIGALGPWRVDAAVPAGAALLAFATALALRPRAPTSRPPGAGASAPSGP